ncbi:MAG: hypothetical protein KY445_15875, partial [Armatimonadetes bacterium]|nr:hypothetical protein [Armatimonadota bacterium]
MPKEPSSSNTTLELPQNGHQNGNGAAEIAVPDEIPTAQLQAAEQSVKGNGHTGWTPGFRAQTNPDKALKFPRRNSKAGQDVFETSQWEKRTAAITGETGKSVFEQKDCEIPANWSQLATNVVVSKYFRGPIDSPQRETSV